MLLLGAIPAAGCITIALAFVVGWPPGEVPLSAAGAAMILLAGYVAVISAGEQFLNLKWCWMLPAVLIALAGFVLLIVGFVKP